MFIIHYFAVVVSSNDNYVTTQSETTHHPVSTSIATIFSTTTRTSEYMLFEVHNHSYGFTNSKVESMQGDTVQCSPYVGDQYTCDPVASQSGDISLAGQCLILYFILC